MSSELAALRTAVVALLNKSPKCECGAVAVGEVPDSNTNSLPSCAKCGGSRLFRWAHGETLAKLADLVAR